MIEHLKNIFSRWLASMTRALFAAGLSPPDLYVEGAELQRIAELASPRMIPGAMLTLKSDRIWFCARSMEISVTAKPAAIPSGLIKMLNILGKNINS